MLNHISIQTSIYYDRQRFEKKNEVKKMVAKLRCIPYYDNRLSSSKSELKKTFQVNRNREKAIAKQEKWPKNRSGYRIATTQQTIRRLENRRNCHPFQNRLQKQKQHNTANQNLSI